MNIKSFRKFLDRDGGCVHCGETEAVSPHHRSNRGMGGSKSKDVPSNIIVMCSQMNLLMEASEKHATMARLFGWKLRPWEDPAEVAFFHQVRGAWFYADDKFILTEKETKAVPAELKEYF
jgi:hypothetical protein